MAESGDTKPICTFLFKKSNKKFSGRKRRASGSDKGKCEFICVPSPSAKHE